MAGDVNKRRFGGGCAGLSFRGVNGGTAVMIVRYRDVRPQRTGCRRIRVLN